VSGRRVIDELVHTGGDPASPADVERVRAETHEALRETLDAC
jgi:hypothetical protein